MTTSAVSPIEKTVAGIESGLRGFIERNDRKASEHDARLLCLEQEVVACRALGGGGLGMDKSIGDIAASRRGIDDSPSLGNFINTRVGYFVEQKVEHELLWGDGRSGHLLGIGTQATALAGTSSDLIAGVAAAASKLAAIGVTPDGCVCNSEDFWFARQIKASGSGVYVFGDPMNLVRTRRPLVRSQSAPTSIRSLPNLA